LTDDPPAADLSDQLQASGSPPDFVGKKIEEEETLGFSAIREAAHTSAANAMGKCEWREEAGDA
jgi:hypothetical protein